MFFIEMMVFFLVNHIVILGRTVNTCREDEIPHILFSPACFCLCIIS